MTQKASESNGRHANRAQSSTAVGAAKRTRPLVVMFLSHTYRSNGAPSARQKITVYSPFEFTVGLCLPLMLTQMLCPGIHQKYFQITIRDFNITEDRPPISAIATLHPTVFMHRIHKLCCPFWNDGVFDGY